MAPPLPAQRQAALRRAIPLAHAQGLTSIHEILGAPLGGWMADYESLRERGELGLRVFFLLPRDDLDTGIAAGWRTGQGDEWIRQGHVKIFMDGTLGSQTADMLDPFEGQPGNTGMATTSAEEIQELVQRASRAGIAVAVHAIGDAANRKVLDAIERWTVDSGRSPEPGAGHRAPVTALRHRIEHAQLLTATDMPRFAWLNVIASMQPIHATSDMLIADQYWGARSRFAYAFRSLLDEGTRLAFGSDSPVETWNVLAGIHAAVTRQRADGTPPEGWYAEQRISVAEAVHAYTLGAAYASYEEDIKGSLTPGKLADLAVLSHDIFKGHGPDILETQVVGTILGGEQVYWQL